MTSFQTDFNDARDAWFLLSWLIWPDDARIGASPDSLRRLANELEACGVAGRARNWPSALRRVADAWAERLQQKDTASG